MTRRTWTAIVAAGVVLVVGAAVILTVVLSTGGEPGPDETAESGGLSSDERDAVWACSVLNELPDPFDEKAMDITQPPLHRAIAAGSLAWAASSASEQWADLQEPGKDLITAASQLNAQKLPGAIDDLKGQCQDVSAVSFESDLELSCDIVDVLPKDIEAEFEDDPLASPALWEMMAIGSLGKAAEYAGEDVPTEVTEAASDLTKAANTLDPELAVEGVSTLQEYCADQD